MSVEGACIGISAEQYAKLRGRMAQVMLVVCAECDTEPIMIIAGQTLTVQPKDAVQVAIDHGWENRPTRGWLCPKCKAPK